MQQESKNTVFDRRKRMVGQSGSRSAVGLSLALVVGFAAYAVLRLFGLLK